ncbi:ATP-binding protein [Catenulispora sp. MAP5-51]|uniref:ATP-binding protein n=1 Tax=Catenulispora sp. MAP5-51 TaxID=3156298 RepID=UPI003511871B
MGTANTAVHQHARFRDSAGEPRGLLGFVRMPARPELVRRAREFTRWTFELAQLPEGTIDAAVLVVSELVSNVVRHGDGEPEPIAELVLLAQPGDTVRIEVHDSGRYPFEPHGSQIADESGRGLMVVAAVASRCGVVATPAGKCAWCEFGPTVERAADLAGTTNCEATGS